MHVLIVGGGIGGLTAALALAREGHTTEVLERAPEFAPIGAGIVLAPNAARIVTALGVDVAGAGHALPAMEIRRADDTLLSRIETATTSTAWGATWALARPALHQALLAALPASVRLRRGATVTRLVEERGGVTVSATDVDTEERFDLVVGADGIHSAVRALTLGPLPLRYSGVTCYRGVLQRAASTPADTPALEAWGDGVRVGVVPLGGGREYYFLVRSAPPRAPPLASVAALRAAFAGFRGEAGRLLAALEALPPLHHDLEELDAPVWGWARVPLLGDAAHAMTPNQGQGAAMAIEDALGLALSLRGGVDGARERYAARRHERVRAIQLDSRRLGQVAHLRGRAVRWLRDAAVRALPDALARRQLTRVVEPGLALLAEAGLA